MNKVKPAFTLLELMIALLITGIVSMGLFSVFNICLKSWDVFTEKAKMSTDVNAISGFITRDIRESLEIMEVGADYIVFKAMDNKIYSYKLQDKVIYKSSAPLLENVSVFNVSSGYDNRFFNFVIELQKKDTVFRYTTGAARRII